MPLTKELEEKAREDINNSINQLVDRYSREGVSLRDMMKYFKPIKMFNILLKDIHFAGRRYFEEGEDYSGYVRKTLDRIMLDRISEEETKSLTTEKKIVKFNDFLNESITFDDVNIDYLYTDVNFSDEDMDIIAAAFDTRKDYIKSKNAKYNSYGVTDFKADVMKNNRTSFDVLILDEDQVSQMIENLVKHTVSGLYASIPQEIEYQGLKVKLPSMVDKQSIKDSVKTMITQQNVLDLVTKLTQYEFEKKYGNYFLWKKAK